MTLLFIILVFVTIGGVSTASFAAERNRNLPAWFVIGCLTGPFGLLVLLLLAPLPEKIHAFRAQNAVLAVIVVVVIMAAATLTVTELVSQYYKSQQYTELSTWDLYGDALIRMGLAKDYRPEAFVVKAARNQIADHERDLREGMRATENQLLMAVRGVDEVRGAWGVVINGFRLLTFRGPRWPAPTGLDPEEQDERIRYLEGQLGKYRDNLTAIDSAQTQWQPKDSGATPEADTATP